MNVRILRPIAWIAAALALALAAIWLLQEAGAVDWVEHPLAGALGFGIVAFVCHRLIGKSGGRAD